MYLSSTCWRLQTGGWKHVNKILSGQRMCLNIVNYYHYAFTWPLHVISIIFYLNKWVFKDIGIMNIKANKHSLNKRMTIQPSYLQWVKKHCKNIYCRDIYKIIHLHTLVYCSAEFHCYQMYCIWIRQFNYKNNIHCTMHNVYHTQ